MIRHSGSRHGGDQHRIMSLLRRMEGSLCRE